MSVQQVMLGLGGSFIVDSAQFDGINDNMARGADLTGAADAKTGVFSCWVRLDGGNGANLTLMSNLATGQITVMRDSGNVFHLFGNNPAGGGIMNFQTSGTYLSGVTWRHVLCSWDLAAGNKNIYINDVSDLGTVTTFTNDTIDYTTGNFWIGTDGATLFKLNGCLAELYFKMGVYLDLSVTANRRKFITGAGKPAYLGVDGTLPGLGTPEIYLHLANGEAVANFATNRGGGGNFTIGGTLDPGSTSPSD